MAPRTRGRSAVLNGLLVVTSGVLWCSVWLANALLLSSTHVAPGIDLVFLPAGFRLLIVLVFGVWGSLGIFLADPLMFREAFGTGGGGEIMVNALISGFAPLLTVRAFCRIAGIESSLLQLRPIHLPLLALAVSVVTPLLFNLHYLLEGRETPGAFLVNFTAMATGDFLGCFLVIGFARIGIAGAQALFPRRP